MNRKAASWSWPGKRISSNAIKIGMATRRLMVSALGMFIPEKVCALLDAEPLQQVVDVGQRHQHLARLRSLVAADDAVLGQLVDDPAGAGVAHVELALH